MIPANQKALDEEWKDVVGYEGLYQISSLGNIKGQKGKLLKPLVNRLGYLKIQLVKDGIKKNKSIHRLVLEAFLHSSELQVDHINSDKADNRLVNLQYVTNRENQIRQRLNKRKRLTGIYATRAGKRFYSRIEVDGVKRYLGFFPTEQEAHEAYVAAYNSIHVKKYEEIEGVKAK